MIPTKNLIRTLSVVLIKSNSEGLLQMGTVIPKEIEDVQ